MRGESGAFAAGPVVIPPLNRSSASTERKGPVRGVFNFWRLIADSHHFSRPALLLRHDSLGTAPQAHAGEDGGGGEKSERQRKGERVPGDEVNGCCRQADNEREEGELQHAALFAGRPKRVALTRARCARNAAAPTAVRKAVTQTRSFCGTSSSSKSAWPRTKSHAVAPSAIALSIAYCRSTLTGWKPAYCGSNSVCRTTMRSGHRTANATAAARPSIGRQ